MNEKSIFVTSLIISTHVNVQLLQKLITSAIINSPMVDQLSCKDKSKLPPLNHAAFLRKLVVEDYFNVDYKFYICIIVISYIVFIISYIIILYIILYIILLYIIIYYYILYIIIYCISLYSTFILKKEL